MPTKKNNIQSVNFSSKAVQVLQMAGFINKRKRSTGLKNLSRFLSELVVDYFNARAEKVEHIAHAIALRELNDLQKEQERISKEIEKKVEIIRIARSREKECVVNLI